MDNRKDNGGHNKVTLTDDQIGQLEKLAQVVSKKWIADLFGISRPTFDKILDENPELLLLYKKGKAKTMAKAGRTLLQKAFGDPDLEIPPDTACLIFYLKTQGEGDWKVEHSGTEVKEIAIDTKSNNEILQEAKEIMSRLSNE
jgi:hypothetical protein